MTKDYALAGLRLGYAVANREIIETLRRVVQPWNVNIMAQKAGISVLDETASLNRSLEETGKAAGYLVNEFSRLGFSYLPSDTHFFLIKALNAKELRIKLLEKGMLVRDCASFGLPGYIRIAARTLPECQKLIKAIETIKTGEPP
jgi:histidinol-phosphate aminotransferase